jgi:hypothetical protein
MEIHYSFSDVDRIGDHPQHTNERPPMMIGGFGRSTIAG